MGKLLKAAPAPEASSIAKVFEVLELFSLDLPLLTVDDIGARMRFTRSTAYRYVKELCDAGFIAPVGGGAYALGPRIVELERQLHLTDPLLQAGQRVLPAVAASNRDGIVLLCSLYRDKVLCILHEGPEEVIARGKKVQLRRARGLPFSLFSGAASLAILAQLPPHRLRSLYLKNQAEIKASGLGVDWEAFRDGLTMLRRAGFVTTMGQLNANLVAVSVPVFLEGNEILGSVTLILPRDRWKTDAEADCVAALNAAALEIGKSVGREGTPAANRTRRKAA